MPNAECRMPIGECGIESAAILFNRRRIADAKHTVKLQTGAGSVFILVLWTLFFLGALALAVGTLVGANINQAAFTKSRTTARMLAKAGVERARFDVIQNPTNWVVKGAADPRSNEELFRDNDDVEGGTFSVTFRYVPEGEEVAVTNYGLMAEELKINIQKASSGTMASEFQRRIGLAEDPAEALAKAIKDCRYWTNAGLTDRPSPSYSNQLGREYLAHEKTFRLLPELMLLNAFQEDMGLYARVEPYLTVHGKDHFSATSRGQVPAPVTARGGGDDGALAEAYIDFVINSSGSVLYWHEY